MTTKRFEAAIKKLYTSFHDASLNPEDCKKCAVGNILDGKDSWKHLSHLHGSTTLSYVGRVHQHLGRRFNGYTPLELLKIESAFLKGIGYYGTEHGRCFKPEDYKSKDRLFDGLCAVVKVLCQLDGIDDIMDYSAVFNYNTPKTKSNTPELVV